MVLRRLSKAGLWFQVVPKKVLPIFEASLHDYLTSGFQKYERNYDDFLGRAMQGKKVLPNRPNRLFNFAGCSKDRRGISISSRFLKSLH